MSYQKIIKNLKKCLIMSKKDTLSCLRKILKKPHQKSKICLIKEPQNECKKDLIKNLYKF